MKRELHIAGTLDSSGRTAGFFRLFSATNGPGQCWYADVALQNQINLVDRPVETSVPEQAEVL